MQGEKTPKLLREKKPGDGECMYIFEKKPEFCSLEEIYIIQILTIEGYDSMDFLSCTSL